MDEKASGERQSSCSRAYVLRDAAGAEDVAIGKVLRRQVTCAASEPFHLARGTAKRRLTNGQFGEDDLGARGDDLVELVIDDLPLGVDHTLVRIKRSRVSSPARDKRTQQQTWYSLASLMRISAF